MMSDALLGPAVCLTRTASFDVSSVAGSIRAVISWPTGDIPPAGLGVIYAMDAAWTFGTLRDAIGLHRVTRSWPTLLVGLGYPTPDLSDPHRREADLVGAHRQHTLQVLLDKIIPRVERAFRVNPQQRMILGHSYGGAFALHAGFSCPTVFSHIGAGSPSIWTAPDDLLGRAVPCKMLIGIGEMEDASRAQTAGHATDRIQRLVSRNMVGNADAMAQRCGVPLRRWTGCDHGQALAPFLSAAPEFLWT